MAAFLCRLGRMAFRRRWYFALLWVAVLIAVGVGAMLAPSAHDDGFSVPGTESQKAQDLVQQRFPDTNGNAAFARIVFVRRMAKS
jgi:RND superfamily putative drug exporter